MCYYTKVYFNITPTIQKKTTENKTSNQKENEYVKIILEINSLDM